MSDAAASESGVAHYPPGAPAPKAADRVAALKSPEHLAKLNAAKADYYALPIEVRRQRRADKAAEKARKAAEREAKRAAKNGGARSPAPEAPQDDAPPTVRSQRPSLAAAPPDSEIPRPGVRGGPLRGLLDVCEALPSLGSGSCFVQVTRTKPTVSFGIQCAGVQRPIWEPLDDAEFSVAYGGGEYVLRGYQVLEHGRAKALTEPVAYKVPGNPNPDSALTEEDAMRPQQHAPNGSVLPRLSRPGIVTPQAATAEADMHSRELDHRETMDQREAERKEEQQRRAERRESAQRQSETEALKIVAQSAEREAERLREVYENKGGGMAEVAELIKAVLPQNRGEDTRDLLRQHSAQIQQLTESNKQELLRLTEQHRTEMQRLQDTHAEALRRVEDQARADRERSDKLVRDTEHRAGEQVREAERRAEARVADAVNAARQTYDDLRVRSEERLRDQNLQWQQRFDDRNENHGREIRQKESELNLMRTGLEGNMQVILAGKDTEIKRLQAEVRAAKDEAEKNKDFVARLGEFERQAEVLGFQKTSEGGGEGEGDDLKTTAIKTGLGMLSQLPQIIQSGADAISKVRNPGSPTDFPGQARGVAARGHTRALPAPPRVPGALATPPLSFDTEGGGYTPPSMDPPPRMAPPPEPAYARPAPPPQPAPAPSQAIVPAEHDSAPQPSQEPQLQAASPPQQQMAPNPQPIAPPPPAPQQEELDPMTLSVIQGLTPDFAAAFSQRAEPADVAARLIEMNGADQVRAALAIVSIDQVIGAIGQDQTPQHSVLKTRNGQKFLRAIWAAAEKAVS